MEQLIRTPPITRAHTKTGMRAQPGGRTVRAPGAKTADSCRSPRPDALARSAASRAADSWVDTHAHPDRFFVRGLSLDDPVFESPRELTALAEALADRDLTDAEIASVPGGNFVRLFEAVAD